MDAPASRTVEPFALRRLVPNPSRDGARIEYALPQAAHVRIGVFDVQGRRVAVLVDGLQPAGSHETMWRDTGASSGLYLVRFEAAGHTATRRLVRIR